MEDRSQIFGSVSWFIGQVPLNQTVNKTNLTKWGDRVQVRILGEDSKFGGQLPDDKLRWALVLKPTSQGTLSRGSTGIIGGEWVVGFFSNSEKEQCFIIGSLGRTNPKYFITEAESNALQSTEFMRTRLQIGGGPDGVVKNFQMSGAPQSEAVGTFSVDGPPASDFYPTYHTGNIA